MKLFLILVLVLLVYYLYFKKRKKVVRAKDEKRVADLVFDEACQTYVKKEEALKIEVQGKTYYFCSKACAEKFLAKTKNLS
ncbi:YHS domain-containing protein [Thermodesulfobacterium hveragerdense]|uniref:YHS domain-containing protein n=1 Tax=Thermodesulfobacterium hveragerdense TaxID=53424 RepID=UPI0003F86E45|nr:YHS domain-containing protein [Thermodesulfobacterium hveragerdense]